MRNAACQVVDIWAAVMTERAVWLESWRASLVKLAEIRPIGLDDLSDIRHLHASAFRIQGGGLYSDQEVDAFTRQVYSNDYADRIFRSKCYGAWIEGHLTGTCGWCPAGDDQIAARISDVFVSPLFARVGLGRMLVGHAEQRAQEAGFKSFTLRVGFHAISLFEDLGYRMTSQGVYNLADDVPLPVAFMRKVAVDAQSGSLDPRGA